VSELDRRMREREESQRDQIHELRLVRAVQGAVFSASPTGVLITNSEGYVWAVNPAIRRTLPVVPDPVGKRPSAAIPFAALHQVLHEVETRRVRIEREATLGRFELSLRAVPVGRDKGAMVVVQDITELRRAARARTAFVSNLGHELRTPITSILGYAETLEDEDLSEDLASLVGPLVRNAQRLAALFDDLLNLARVESRKGDLPLSHQDIGSLAQDVVRGLRDTARESGVTLVYEGPSGVVARTNPEAFRTILSNLVINGIKYTAVRRNQARSSVFIRVLPPTQTLGARVEVTDQGIGIDPRHHGRIFERFYRVDQGRSREAGGTGLGLAIVKHLCEASHASISLRSLPDEGASFTLTLPS
jgi:two-component system phosphate regulon sensor histidine kinase PhoR